MNAADRKTLLTAVVGFLRTQIFPLTAARIRAGLPAAAALSETELEKIFDRAFADEQDPIDRMVQGDLKLYFVEEETPEHAASAGGKLEKDLYEPFRQFLEKNGLRAAVLDHTRARRKGQGENAWRYPDLVAFRPAPPLGPEVLNVARLTGAEPRGDLIGYEVKTKLSASNVRLTFFECLANSAWANRRYAVAPGIDNEAQIEFKRLAGRYPVGLMELAFASNDNGVVESARILVECPRGEIDPEAIQELAGGWPDFQDFFNARIPGIQ